VNKKMLALYGLKWNPFAPDVPVEALHVTRRIESFCWRVQQLVGEGGVAGGEEPYRMRRRIVGIRKGRPAWGAFFFRL
jgi:hypothetical protein